jgi:phosphoenolpyruvate synthase/pyruvate phosphate dikinase
MKTTKTEWQETARRGKNHAVLVMDDVLLSFSQNLVSKNIPGLKIRHFRQFDGARWFGVEDARNYLDALKRLEAQKEGNLLKLAHNYVDVLQGRRKWADKIAQADPKKVSNDQLAEIIAENSRQNCIMMSYSYNYIFLNKYYSDQLASEIAKKVKDIRKQTEILKILFALEKPSDMRLEKEAILRIVKQIKTQKLLLSGQKVKQLIRMHCDKYAYLGFYYYWGKPYDHEAILDRVRTYLSKDIDKILKEIDNLSASQAEANKVITELDLDDQTQMMIETIKAWGYAANYFDETYNYFVAKLYKFLQEIGSRLDVSFNQLVSARSSEIIDFLKKGQIQDHFKKELACRYKNHAIILDDDGIRVICGKELEEYAQQETVQQEEYSHIKMLKGQPAAIGRATGKARVLVSIDEISKVRKGEILIAASTTPSHVPAMEKAAAIVTNEGGLLSHAAIVSRELGIPCVVGTKIATKVFKDGDMVEVDADKGIIHKLK